uniref:Putative secreted peptide n=1 Tax=Anopheles braziliensis TaxID=58242 RepID=A0A2M3ZVE7_9DIPT
MVYALVSATVAPSAVALSVLCREKQRLAVFPPRYRSSLLVSVRRVAGSGCWWGNVREKCPAAARWCSCVCVRVCLGV